MSETKANRTCFVIAPIGEPGSETRKRSDQVLKHIIGPAATMCAYTTLRADQISEPGIITTQIIQHLIDDPMVVADLTERNPNVFYELAIRHALRKPYVQIIQKGERIPFDLAAVRTVEVDHHDLDSAEAAKREIVRQMQTLQQPGAEVESPISVAVDLEVLRERGNPAQRQLAEILPAVAELKAGLAALGFRLDTKLSQEFLDSLKRPRLPGLAAEELVFVLDLIGTLDTTLDSPEVGDATKVERMRRVLHLAKRLLDFFAIQYDAIETWASPTRRRRILEEMQKSS